MSKQVVRRATVTDVPFLVEAVLAAEKSGTDRAPIARLFGLQEDEVRALLKRMFEEEIDGCEFSVTSSLIAEVDGRPAAAVAGWIEGANEDDMPSQMLRTNLIGFTFPPHAMAAMRAQGPAVASLSIPRKKDSLQIENVYVDPLFRNKGLAAMLINAHMQRVPPQTILAQVQVFAHNIRAVRLYASLGFRVQGKFLTEHPLANALLPYPEKLLMERPLPWNHGTF